MRRAQVCPAKTPICPSCEQPIRRITVPPDGGVYAYCENRDGSSRCGQHVYAVGMAGNLCAVVPITSEEFQEFTQSELTIREVTAATGVLK